MRADSAPPRAQAIYRSPTLLHIRVNIEGPVFNFQIFLLGTGHLWKKYPSFVSSKYFYRTQGIFGKKEPRFLCSNYFSWAEGIFWSKETCEIYWFKLLKKSQKLKRCRSASEYDLKIAWALAARIILPVKDWFANMKYFYRSSWKFENCLSLLKHLLFLLASWQGRQIKMYRRVIEIWNSF